MNLIILAIISTQIDTFDPYYANLQPKDNNAQVWLIMHVLMAELFPASHKLNHPDGRSIRRQCPFYNRRVYDDAIKVYMQLDGSSIY